MGSRTLGKDIQYQASTIEYSTLKQLFEVTFLTGTEGMIKDDHLGPVATHLIANLLRLT